jgi:NAD(P)-dependent dehydrogenase (short-subunit alcohol dehydrogenase family)
MSEHDGVSAPAPGAWRLDGRVALVTGAQWGSGRRAARDPLGRLAEPSDQAALALFLAGDGARHITGQDLTVDGGQTVG